MLAGAITQPVVGPGASKEEVINAYGWPSGQSQAGAKEILTYPQGRVTLEHGRVERVDFSTSMPWPAPRPRPEPASATSVKKAEAPVDFWLLGWEDARREATRRNARVLALFIGSDWSPPSQMFQAEVAFHADFVNAFTGDFVFLRLDFPNRAPQPAELREQNNRLREKYGVTKYPALLILSPAGTVVATVDLTKLGVTEAYRANALAAIRETRDRLIANPPPPDPLPVAAAVTPEPAAPSKAPDDNVKAFVNSTFDMLKWAVGSGVVLAFLGWWFLWRKTDAATPSGGRSSADRIADASSGLPNREEMAGWSREKLCAVISGLAATDGYETSPRAGKGDGDLALTRKDEATPAVIVMCLPAESGVVSAKRLKELFGIVTVEGVGAGWCVAPHGFSSEARNYASTRPLVLIDGDHLLGQLRAAPPILIPRILSGS